MSVSGPTARQVPSKHLIPVRFRAGALRGLVESATRRGAHIPEAAGLNPVPATCAGNGARKKFRRGCKFKEALRKTWTQSSEGSSLSATSGSIAQVPCPIQRVRAIVERRLGTEGGRPSRGNNKSMGACASGQRGRQSLLERSVAMTDPNRRFSAPVHVGSGGRL